MPLPGHDIQNIPASTNIAEQNHHHHHHHHHSKQFQMPLLPSNLEKPKQKAVGTKEQAGAELHSGHEGDGGLEEKMNEQERLANYYMDASLQVSDFLKL